MIIPLPAFKDNYMWLMVNPHNHKAVVVDPGDPQPVLAYLNKHQLTLEALLITHHHWDHSGGVETLVEHNPLLPVYGPAKEAKTIGHVNHPLEEGDCITLPGLGTYFHVLDIPGHTAGHIAYYGPLGVFCGDTLFSGGCGRLFEGTPEEMTHSLKKLSQLPPETLIYCGHEYTESNLRFAQKVEPHNLAIKHHLTTVQALRKEGKPTLPSTIALEKTINPFLRTHLPEVKKAAEYFSGQKLFKSSEIFGTIRKWKDNS